MSRQATPPAVAVDSEIMGGTPCFDGMRVRPELARRGNGRELNPLGFAAPLFRKSPLGLTGGHGAPSLPPSLH